MSSEPHTNVLYGGIVRAAVLITFTESTRMLRIQSILVQTIQARLWILFTVWDFVPHGMSDGDIVTWQWHGDNNLLLIIITVTATLCCILSVYNCRSLLLWGCRSGHEVFSS